MKLLTAREMSSLDRQAVGQYGVPSLTLMENAGRSVAAAAVSMTGPPDGCPVAIFCGKGNNGGDGLVAARHLLTRGARPRVYLLGSFQDLKGDARINLETATRTGVEVRSVTDGETLNALERYEEAEASLAEAHSLLGSELPATHPDLADVRSHRGTALAGLGRFDEAERLLLEAHQALAAVKRLDPGRVSRAAERVANFYQDRGHERDASSWQQRAQSGRRD